MEASPGRFHLNCPTGGFAPHRRVVRSRVTGRCETHHVSPVFLSTQAQPGSLGGQETRGGSQDHHGRRRRWQRSLRASWMISLARRGWVSEAWPRVGSKLGPFSEPWSGRQAPVEDQSPRTPKPPRKRMRKPMNEPESIELGSFRAEER